MISEITDHVARGLSRIITQFRDSVDLRVIISALATEVQVLESAINQVVLYVRNVNQAGADAKTHALSQHAKIVGAREPLVYLIQSQIPVNVSQGRINDLLQVYANLVEPFHGGPSWIDDAGTQGGTPPGGPQVFLIEAENSGGAYLSVGDASTAIALLSSAAPAGVRVILICNIDPLDVGINNPFHFDSDPFDDPTFLFKSALDSPNNL